MATDNNNGNKAFNSFDGPNDFAVGGENPSGGEFDVGDWTQGSVPNW